MKSGTILISIIAIIIVIGAIFFFTSNSLDTNPTTNPSDTLPEENQQQTQNPDEPSAWLTTELTDINSGQTFTIKSLNEMGKPIIIESFAVWCPVCKNQQNHIKALHEEVGYSEEEVTSINLNTDPNEDEARVQEFLEENDFTWRYAVAPSQVTQSLVDEFGPSIVNAPSAPIVIICPSGDYFKVSQNGAKDPQDLKAELAKC